jgi:trimethylamine-N-oxide reductase (cytochrome c)
MGMLNATYVDHNPDSWEGWHWGATHHFGFYWRLGSPETYDLLEDTLRNSEMIVFCLTTRIARAEDIAARKLPNGASG